MNNEGIVTEILCLKKDDITMNGGNIEIIFSDLNKYDKSELNIIKSSIFKTSVL